MNTKDAQQAPARRSELEDKLFTSNFQSLVDSFIKGNSFMDSFMVGDSFPKVDVYMLDGKEDMVYIEAAMAGIPKEEVEVKVEEGRLYISRKAKESLSSPVKKYLHKELKQSNFERVFSLGDKVDQENIKAEFNDGILKIDVPLHEPRSRVIEL